ncbi:DUF416 family protein [Bermanella marisrubri]|uniref:Orphan protein n=1 Tax=Bermanella marisrubri TaxID=207949 RepID=Q1N0Q8_9GAMM|nr:DUF416 family protein [Bermanella marisrubri]EAT11775.1 hypothetical protein RED65_05294 [Oceanobacter sp. RED65] [Bermanella marisrubri]QIZ83810.1 DUF416 family protein [Bermanella marisrubri]
MNQLNHWQQLTICCALCERSMPNLDLYCELTETSELAQNCRKMLNKVWEYLRGQLKSEKNIEKQLILLNDIMPELDEDQFGALAANDCLVALQSCLQAILDKSISDAEAISQMMSERLDQFLELQGFTTDHELVQRHSAFVIDLEQAVASQTSHADVVKQLMPLAKDGGLSHLGISLDD